MPQLRGKAHPNWKGNLAYSNTVEYRCWVSMRQRCNNPNDISYKNYGGRGIQICKRWSKFENFLADMGHKPSPQHSLERINNNGNYTPKNCKWGTRGEQALNTRKHRAWLKRHGLTM